MSRAATMLPPLPPGFELETSSAPADVPDALPPLPPGFEIEPPGAGATGPISPPPPQISPPSPVLAQNAPQISPLGDLLQLAPPPVQAVNVPQLVDPAANQAYSPPTLALPMNLRGPVTPPALGGFPMDSSAVTAGVNAASERILREDGQLKQQLMAEQEAKGEEFDPAQWRHVEPELFDVYHEQDLNLFTDDWRGQQQQAIADPASAGMSAFDVIDLGNGTVAVRRRVARELGMPGAPPGPVLQTQPEDAAPFYSQPQQDVGDVFTAPSTSDDKDLYGGGGGMPVNWQDQNEAAYAQMQADLPKRLPNADDIGNVAMYATAKLAGAAAGAGRYIAQGVRSAAEKLNEATGLPELPPHGDTSYAGGAIEHGLDAVAEGAKFTEEQFGPELNPMAKVPVDIATGIGPVIVATGVGGPAAGVITMVAQGVGHTYNDVYEANKIRLGDEAARKLAFHAGTVKAPIEAAIARLFFGVGSHISGTAGRRLAQWAWEGATATGVSEAANQAVLSAATGSDVNLGQIVQATLTGGPVAVALGLLTRGLPRRYEHFLERNNLDPRVYGPTLEKIEVLHNQVRKGRTTPDAAHAAVDTAVNQRQAAKVGAVELTPQDGMVLRDLTQRLKETPWAGVGEPGAEPAIPTAQKLPAPGQVNRSDSGAAKLPTPSDTALVPPVAPAKVGEGVEPVQTPIQPERLPKAGPAQELPTSPAATDTTPSVPHPPEVISALERAPEGLRSLVKVRRVRTVEFPVMHEGEGGRWEPDSKTVFVEQGEEDPAGIIAHEAMHSVIDNLDDAQFAQQYIRARYADRPPGVVDDYLAELGESGRIRGLGGYLNQVEENMVNDLATFARTPEKLQPAIREIFEAKFGKHAAPVPADSTPSAPAPAQPGQTYTAAGYPPNEQPVTLVDHPDHPPKTLRELQPDGTMKPVEYVTVLTGTKRYLQVRKDSLTPTAAADETTSVKTSQTDADSPPVAPALEIQPTPGLSGAAKSVNDELVKIVSDTAAADAAYDKLPESQGGKVIATDIARELSPKYRDRAGRLAFGDATEQPARDYAYNLLLRRLATPPPPAVPGEKPRLMLNAGGPGSGKSSTLSESARVNLTYDSTLGNFDRAVTVIETAKQHGWQVAVRYVHRPYDQAVLAMLERGAESGRTVPLGRGGSMAAMHINSQEVAIRLADRYGDDPDVDLIVLDNSQPGRAPRPMSLSKLAEMRYTDLRRLYDTEAAQVERARQEGVTPDVIDAAHGVRARDDARGDQGAGQPPAPQAGEQAGADSSAGVGDERPDDSPILPRPGEEPGQPDAGPVGERGAGALDEVSPPPGETTPRPGLPERGGDSGAGERAADGSGPARRRNRPARRGGDREEGVPPADTARGSGPPDDGGDAGSPPGSGAGADAGDQPGRPVARNYRIPDPDNLVPAGVKSRFRANVDAIETLRRIEAEGRAATPDEQAILARFSGWGSMPGAFNTAGNAGDWAREAEELKHLLTESEHAAGAKSTLNAHYTSGRVVGAIWQLLRNLGLTPGARVLEPSMGIGNFFGLMPPDLAAGAKLTGVELDELTGRMARALYPQANVQVKGFQDLHVPNGFFDLAVSNVPFGDFRVHDPAYNKHHASIHDYFFLKSLDEVRPGGIVAFLTSRYTLDKADPRIRKLLAERGDLIAALRLPDTAFAKNAGTEVVTDLLIFRRRAPGEAAGGAAFEQLGSLPAADGGAPIDVNEYYASHPENILGKLDRSGTMYGGGQVNVSGGGDFQELLERAIARMPKDVYLPPEKSRPEQAPVVTANAAYTKEGGLVVQDGKLHRRKGDTLIDHGLTPAQEKIAREAIGVRDAVKELFDAQLTGKADTDALRKTLNRLYDAFVKKHGPLNKPANAAALDGDPDRPVLLALEKWDKSNKTAAKSDAFFKDTVRVYTRPTSADSPGAALGISLNEAGRVDLPRVAELLKVSETEAGDQLAAAGLAYPNPAGNWESADKYLSGDVRQKLKEASDAAAADPKYRPNVEALAKVQPADVDYAEIGVKMGVPWVPPADVARFAADMLGGSVDDISVGYLPTTGQWMVEYTPQGARRWSFNEVTRTALGTPGAPFHEIVNHALNGKAIILRKRIDKDTTVVDHEASAEANAKVEELQQRFHDWIWQDDERRQRLHRAYNDTYNSIRNVERDAKHYRSPDGRYVLPGQNPLISLRPHQANSVWQIVSDGRALLAHEVGTGKTYTKVAAAMELKRLGLAHKPAIAVLKSTLPGYLRDARLLYPNARIHVVEQFDAKRRKQMVSQIATGDYDMVILTHDHLDMLPMSADVQAGFIRRELDELEAVKRQVEEMTGGPAKSKKSDNKLVKALEKAKLRLQERLTAALDSKKDDAVTFEQTGIDFLFVDEAHKYKSLPVYTTQDRIKGIPTSRSDRATNMWMRTQWLQQMNGGRGVVMATGTPVTNTMAELYTFQRYLQMPELESRGIAAFDAWARTFGQLVTKMEYTVSGDYAPVTRFAKFSNLPELAQLAGSFMDVQRADAMPDVKRPKRIDQVIAVPMNAGQKEYLQRIKKRAAALKHTKPEKGADNMLKVSGDARKSAIDLRMVDPTAAADDTSKMAAAANKVLELWKKHPTATQMIFSDIGVHPTAWGYSAYRDVIDRLVAGGIPPGKIINFAELTDVEKRKATDRLDKGDALIGIGSTDKLGTGVNAQTHLLALHHLDVPWLPGYVEQRDGRGWRQGNKNPTGAIHIFRYVTEGSFDTFMWQVVDTKTKFIKQVVEGKAPARNLSEEGGEELSAAQVMAIASGNPLLLDKVQVDQDVTDLSAAQRRHASSQAKLRDSDLSLRRQITNETHWRDSLAKDLELSKQAGDGFSITIQGKTFDKRDEAAAALISAQDGTPDKGEIGTFRGFKLQLRRSLGVEPYVIATGPGDNGYQSSGMSLGSLEYVVRPTTLQQRHDAAVNKIKQLEADRKKLAGEVGKPFAKAEDLAAAKKRQEEIAKALLAQAEAGKGGGGQKPPDAPPAAGAADDDAMHGGIDDLTTNDKPYIPAPADAESASIEAKANPPSVPRIPVAPLPGGQEKRLDQISLDLQKSIAHKVRVAQPPRGAGGVYMPNSTRTSVRYTGDLDLTAHEVAHLFDDRFGIVGTWAKPRVRSPYDKELIPNFSGYGSVKKSGEKSKLWYQRAEGVAEYLRAWMVNPDAAAAAAPKFTAYLRTIVPPAELAKLRAFGDDIRRWAGSPAAQRQLSNVRIEPEPKSLLDKLREPFKDEPWSFTTTWLDKLDAAVRDHLSPVMKGIAFAKRLRVDLGPTLPARDPETLMRALAGFNDVYTDMLDNGLRRPDLKKYVDLKTGKPLTLEWLYEPLDRSSKESLDADAARVIALGISERTIEKAKILRAKLEEKIGQMLVDAGFQTGQYPVPDDPLAKRIAKLRAAVELRIGRLSGTGGGIFSDEQQAAQAITELAADTKLKNRIDEALRRYRVFARGVLTYYRDAGRLSKEAFERIVKENEFYFDFHRLIDRVSPPPAGVSNRLGSAAQPLQRFKGSTRLIENPYVNLLESAYKMYREADRNKAVGAFIDLLTLDRKMYDGPPVDLDAVGSKAKPGDSDTIPYYRGGELEQWQFEPLIHTALKGFFQITDQHLLWRLATLPATVIRASVTHTPGFIARNVIRDTFNRSVISEHGAKPWDVAGRPSEQELSDFRAAGGEQFGHYMGSPEAWHKELRRRMRELAGDKGTILLLPGKLLRSWHAVSKASEMVGRMAEYRRAHRHAKEELGYDDENATRYAAARARGLLDFAISGYVVKSINQVIPFFNAAVQGPARVYRSAKGDPRGTLLRWGTFVLLPTLFNYLWNLAMGDEEEYRQLPHYRRDFFWNFKVGHLWLSIPKPFEIGVLSTGVERLIDLARGKANSFDGYAGSLAKSTLPVDEAAMVGPLKGIIENTSNYSFFFGRNIVPSWEEGKDLALRDTSRASRLGQAVQTVTQLMSGGVDARKIDNFIYSQTGGIGKLAMDLSDVGRGDRQPQRFLASGVGLFTFPPASSANDVQVVQDLAKKLGEEQSPRMKRLRVLLHNQQRATTAAERDKLAADVRAYAKGLRELYEKNYDSILEGKQAKFGRRLQAAGAR